MSLAVKQKEELIWLPQEGPQTLLCVCPIQDILYGGARGGGKTDGMLGHWMYHAFEFNEHAKGLFIRRTMPELEEVISRAKVLFADVATWKEQKKTLMFHNGAVLKFRFLERDSHADRYQGHEYTWICIEEAGNFPSPIPIDTLRATLRSGQHKVTLWFLMTANPGGSGHNWIKARYIDPAMPLTPFESTFVAGDRTFTVKRIFIPSKLADNKLLVESNPNYVSNVAFAAAGRKWLFKAWMDGNWNIVAGGMFDDIYNEDIHILEPFKIPYNWTIYRAFDWGSSKPFSVGWWAKTDGSSVRLANGKIHTFTKDTLIRIDEFYGWNGIPNQGLNMNDSTIAERIKEHEELMKWEVDDGPADPMIFNETNGGSISDYYVGEGIYWVPADKGIRVTGWVQVREMLSEAVKEKPEKPCMFVFSNCLQWRRTVPTLPRDKANIDDVDSDAEDHIGDETRYMVRFKPQICEQQKLGGL